MSKLNNLAVSLCQMRVVSGRPDLNAGYIIKEIEEAKKRGIDIIAFPELATTGYLIGDLFEDAAFISDVMRFNQEIAFATAGGITAVFGTVLSVSNKKGEDGRPRLHNAAVVAHNGTLAGWTIKTLQPNYRFFNDDKHFFATRKKMEEDQKSLDEYLKPFTVATRNGPVNLGVILCEDMWHNDYALNPTKVLVQNGAELILNLSASPWTWKKNRKRHQIVRTLLEDCRVPFCYVNNTGTQTLGKNIITFDGSSTIYSATGDIISEVAPYFAGAHDFVFTADMPPVLETPADDTEELYAAMMSVARSSIPQDVHIVVGLSGGIDSALVAAHLVDVFGPARVIGINMPFLNGPETQMLAKKIAENLGIQYEIIPIKDIVESICTATNVKPNSLAYENVQARVRQEVLAAFAQRIGGVFTCNSNKIEMAFGYGTLYGDIAGCYAPLGDLVKREVRQMADYVNRVRFGREVIPQECITQRPTAELAANQFDPFDYGTLERRGYHDEMVRAFTEFRKNPEWFLELYIGGKLEKELLLPSGTLSALFLSLEDFIKDLESHWKKFHASYFKRIQCPPIPVFSKRAFGRDLEESILKPHFTQRYYALKEAILSTQPKVQRIALCGGSFNPPGVHHQDMIRALTERFDVVIVVPCGIRKDKISMQTITPAHRKEMIRMAFENMPRVAVDYYDLENDVFTPHYDLDMRYQNTFPDAELWYVVGGDIVKNGGTGASEIQAKWKKGEEIWRTLRFAVVTHPRYLVQRGDLPPSSKLIELPTVTMTGRSSLIRSRIASGESCDGLLASDIADYIKKNNLYR